MGFILANDYEATVVSGMLPRMLFPSEAETTVQALLLIKTGYDVFSTENMAAHVTNIGHHYVMHSILPKVLTHNCGVYRGPPGDIRDPGMW